MVFSLDNINPNVIKAKYAVRGPIVELAQQLEVGGKEIYYFNIGNPQQLGQSPLTYPREILAMLNHPVMLEKPDILHKLNFAEDNVEKVKTIISRNPSGIGAYSQSAGMPFIREAVAEFIQKRDGIPTSADDIFLTDGASKGVDLILKSFIKSNVGIMIPIPQYPLYSADITLFGGKQVHYYLDESNGWSLNEAMIEESYKNAKKSGVDVKGIVVINPNNPTGSVLSKKSIKMVLEFANRHSLFIIADEVYQENIYDKDSRFYSFAKIAHENNVEIPLFSLHSTSKGFMGECGYRGGYLELRNITKEIKMELLKIRSISLCSNTSGQVMMYLMVTPPKSGEFSYDTYIKEKNQILNALNIKAQLISKYLDEIDGVSCSKPQGAMYLFPKLSLSTKSIESTKPLDYLFCRQLVTDAGIVTVPGSGFGQMPGTWHLRMTFLPPEDKIETIMNDFTKVFQNFNVKS